VVGGQGAQTTDGTVSGGVATGPGSGGPGAAPGTSSGSGTSIGSGSGVAAPGAAGPAGAPAPGAGPKQGQGGPSGPGVSAKSILVGIDVRVGSDEQASKLGVKEASIGNMRAQMGALVDDLNRRGGILGRRVQPVYAEYQGMTAAQTETEEQAACSKYTEDNRVFAVISAFNGGTTVLRDCLQKANVPLITYAPLDEPTQQRLTTYFAPGTLQLDRAATTVVSGLAGLGFLGKASKVGVLYADSDVYPAVLKRSMLPALKRVGVASVTTASISLDDASTASRDAQSAVLAFKEAKVDRVLSLGAGGLPVGLFMTQAESQAYRPDYGLTSYDYPETVRPNVPKEQMEGMQGIGWQFTDPTTQPAETGLQKRCLDTMRKAGQSAADANQKGVFYQDCDLVWFFEAAANRAGSQLTTSTFSTAATALGRSFQSALNYRTDFASGRRDGVAATRAFRYETGCSCIVAFGPTRDLP
jgi:ABC-type branched-subunit amino acid transport system substrate-binding protein